MLLQPLRLENTVRLVNTVRSRQAGLRRSVPRVVRASKLGESKTPSDASTASDDAADPSGEETMYTDSSAAHPSGSSSTRARHRLWRRTLAVTLLVGPALSATTITGPLVPCLAPAIGPATNGTIFTFTGGAQHPVPAELQPTADFTFQTVSNSSLLISRTGGGTSCLNPDGSAGTVLYFHDAPAASGDPLTLIRGPVCIPRTTAEAVPCIYDRNHPFSPQRIAGIRELPSAIDGSQRTLWIDLTGPPNPADTWSTQTSPIQSTRFGPAGDVAVTHHDLSDPVGDPNWAVIDLCSGSVGSVLANVLDVPNPVTPSVVAKPNGDFVVRLSRPTGISPEVLLPACLGPPPPPPPTARRLAVVVQGAGDGVVISTPPTPGPPNQIRCALDGNPNQCVADFAVGSEVTLFAQGRNFGTSFVGWSSDCTGTANQTAVTLDTDRTCTATFDEVRAELTASSVLTPSPATAGGRASFVVTIENQGPDPATNLSLTAVSTAGADFDPSSLHPGCVQGVDLSVTCNLGALPANDPQEITFDLDIEPFARGSVGAEASATTTTYESDPDDNTTQEEVPVTVLTDLGLTKFAYPLAPVPGAPIAYRFEVSNSGPSGSAGATLVDTLPAELSYPPQPLEPAPSFPVGPLGPGRSLICSVEMRVDPGATPGQTLINTGEILSVDADGNSSNDLSTVSSTVAASSPAGSPPALTVIADTSTPVPFGQGNFSRFLAPAAAGGGSVVFGGRDQNSRVGLYRWSDGRILEVAVDGATSPDGLRSFSGLGSNAVPFSDWTVSGDQVAFIGQVAFLVGAAGRRSSLIHSGDCFLEAWTEMNEEIEFESTFGGEAFGSEVVHLLSIVNFVGIVLDDGASRTVLYGVPLSPTADAVYLSAPSWDGTTAAFVRSTYPPAGGSPLAVDLMVVREGVATVLVSVGDPVPGGPGAFTRFESDFLSVDGDLLAFRAEDGNGDSGIYVVEIPTATVHVVANSTTVVPGTSATFSWFTTGSGPSVSNGRVAFSAGAANFDEAGLYLWRGSTQPLQRLLAWVNDPPLPGASSTLNGAHLDPESFDGDHIVFTGEAIWRIHVDQVFADGFESGNLSSWN